MKILADEGVERPIVIRLRVEGHQVIYIAEVAAGSTDPEVLEIAFREQALLIAVDKDFGDLIFRKRHKSVGVMLLRFPESLSAQEKAGIIVDIIKRHSEDLYYSFTVITPDRLRIMRLPSWQGPSEAEK